MKLYKERLLSNSQLKRLREHKYSCTSDSILDPYMQYYWCWLSQKVPLWLAPNLITITGLLINILSSLILVSYSLDAKQEVPRWACAFCGLGIFIYQSLDAIDGKQARRTGSANPLGELFDHGCDSVSTVFVALAACAVIQLGQSPAWMFFQCFFAITLFYCAHWQTYVSGTLRFGRFDVTEVQLIIMSIHFLSAIFGNNIWSIKLFGSISIYNLIPITTLCTGLWSSANMFTVIFTGGVGKNGSTVALPLVRLPIRMVPILLGTFMAVCLAYSNTKRIFSGGAGKNGSTVAGTSIISPVIPFSTVLIPAIIIYCKSEQRLYENHPVLYILAFGLAAAKITNRLVVAHMTKSEMEYMDLSFCGPAMLFLNQYFNYFLPEYLVLWLCLIWVVIDLMRYCSQICKEICEYLEIELFRIPYPGSQPKTPSHTHHSTVEKNGTNNRTIKTRSRSNKHH